MAVTKTWEINTLERDLSDGFVKKVIYRVIGLSDSVEKSRLLGEIIFTKPDSLPSDFVAFASLDASTVLGWVQTALGSTEVSRMETNLEAQVNKVLTPTSATGLPDGWS